MATATNGTNTLSFSYDDNGVRVRKTVNGVDHLYTVNGSQILAEEWGNELLVYLYDANGAPIGMEYRNSTYAPGAYDLFVFETNMFGDITGVYDADGNKLISYTYDAWGNCQTTLHTQNLSGSDYYAQKNPFRYRGYYYDTELGLYYLNARYYDPNTGRFISADSIEYLGADGSLIGYNLYAYCDNNPVMNVDLTGHFVISLTTALIGMAIGAVVGLGLVTYTDYLDDGQVFNNSIGWKGYLGGALLGAGIGGLAVFAGAALAAFAEMSFAIGSTITAAGELVAVAVSGAEALAIGAVVATCVLLSKGSGPRMGHNQHEKKMWDQAMRDLGISDKDLQQRLHHELHRYPYQEKYKGLKHVLEEILRKWGKLQ